jgi:outer membrane biosynthesis protein TonB
MLALYRGLQAQADSARTRQESQRVAGTRPTLPLERYVGTYEDSLYGAVTVTHGGGKLELQRGARRAVLEHWHYDTFRARWQNAWQGTSMLTFIVGPRGTPDRVEMSGATLRRVEPSVPGDR